MLGKNNDAVFGNSFDRISPTLLSVFHDAMACPELPETKAELKGTRLEFCRNCGVKLSPDIKVC